jgi:hypothetical protein
VQCIKTLGGRLQFWAFAQQTTKADGLSLRKFAVVKALKEAVVVVHGELGEEDADMTSQPDSRLR